MALLKKRRVFLFLLSVGLSFWTDGVKADESLGEPKKGAEIVLTPQFIVDRVLRSSLSAEQINILSQKSQVGIYEALGTFDLNVVADAGYTYSKAEIPTGLSQPKDKIWEFGVGVEKKFSSGTSLSTRYARMMQDTELNSFSSSFRSSEQTFDRFDFTVRQNLLYNFFGKADRLRLDLAHLRDERSRLNRTESLENLALQALDLFWMTYVARQSLEESLATKKKFDRLVETVRRKRKVGAADSADLNKAVADLENITRSVKNASAAYINQLDLLLNLLRLKGEVRFEVPSEVKALPDDLIEKPIAVLSLRPVQLAQKDYESALLDQDLTWYQGLPQLDFIARATYTGRDSSGSTSFSEMTSGSKPEYFLGIEIIFPIGSDRVSATQLSKRLQLEEAMNRLQQEKERLDTEINNMKRDVRAKYLVVQSAMSSADRWDKIIAQQEQKYRQGRIDTDQLIREYRSSFAAQAGKNVALANYYLTLHRYRAASDELLKLDRSSPDSPTEAAQ